jgi:hypothetical protein
MAMNSAERSAKTAKRRRDSDEEELRVWTKPATRTVLQELMEWHGITEQAEAVTLLLHHIHGLGREGSKPFLTPPRHVYVIPENVARKLEIAYSREALRIGRDE